MTALLSTSCSPPLNLQSPVGRKADGVGGGPLTLKADGAQLNTTTVVGEDQGPGTGVRGSVQRQVAFTARQSRSSEC